GFHVLDTRQFRDDQACGDGYQDDCPAAVDPSRSITGRRQERWPLDEFRASRARWDVIGQQVFFAQRAADAGPVHRTSMDSWDGYVASRDRITKGWADVADGRCRAGLQLDRLGRQRRGLRPRGTPLPEDQ